MKKFINIGKKDKQGNQVRIEHRGRHLRVSRTGGVSVRAQTKAAGVNISVNSRHGVRLSKQIAKGTQVSMQNGRLQVRGRYSKGPHNINVSKSGVTLSTRNALGTFNWAKPNRSSAKVFGVQMRGKAAAQAQMVYGILMLFHTAVMLAVRMVLMAVAALQWLGLTLIQGAQWLSTTLADYWAKYKARRQDARIAQRLSHVPASWQDQLDSWSAPQQLAAVVWILTLWGQGKKEMSADVQAVASRLPLSQRLDSALLQAVGEGLNALTQAFASDHLVTDELALLALLCQRLAATNATAVVEDILLLDERLSQQGKTCLQETMIGVALDYAGARCE